MVEALLQGQGHWQQGNAAWGARHGGRTYLFANPQAQQKFLAEPERYAPLASGIDIVQFLETGQIQDGRIEHATSIEGRILLFASNANYEKFNHAPDDYLNGLRQAQLENRLQIR